MARKSKDIKKFSDEELGIEIRDARRKFFDIRCQKVTEKIEDTSQFGKVKKKIARLLTEQSKRSKTTAEVSS